MAPAAAPERKGGGMVRRRPSPADDRARRAFGIAAVTVEGRRLAVRESVRLPLPFADLRVFSREDGAPGTALVVAPLAGGFPFLLRDLVIALLRQVGHVAVSDWFDARHVEAEAGRFGFAENVLHVLEMIRSLGAGTHVVAVCQGAVPALAATALLARRPRAPAPRALVLMGGPIDPLANATRAVHFARAHDLGWFDRCVISRVPEGYAGAGRLVYPGSLQLQTFLGYVARHSVEKDEVFWKFVADDGEDPFSFPFSLLSMSMMDLTREFFLENLQAVYREPALMAGTMEVGGVPVDLSAITRTALMTVEGERDDLCAPGQTRGAHALCPRIPENRRARLLVPGSGHFSLFHGRTCRKTVVPAITAFWAGLGA